jgi:hypothetical protein
MSMFPPELESTKYSGPPAPAPEPRFWFEVKAHPNAFWHSFLAFTAANLPYPIMLGWKPLHLFMALLVGFAFAVRHGRRQTSLRWIYGIAAVWCVVSAFLAASYAG